MSFYIPRRYSQTQIPLPNAAMNSSAMNPLMQNQRGSVAQSITPAQEQNPLVSGASNALGGYKAAKGGSEMYNDASRLYDRWTMPSGVNPDSVMAGSGDANAANANFMNGGNVTNFPQGAPTAQAADNASFMGQSGTAAENPLMTSSPSPMLDNALASSGTAADATANSTAGATAASSGADLMGGAATDTAATTGADLMGSAATDAAATAAADAAATAGAEGAGAAAAEGAGALGAEEAGLSALGPVGWAAGLGLLASKMFKLW